MNHEKVLGRYEVVRRLAVGGMGEVFLGRECDTGRPVIVKALLPDLARKPSAVAEFLSEAEVLVQLEHPNVVHVLEAGPWEDTYALVMELILGADVAALRDAAKQKGIGVPFEIAAQIVRDAARGLAYAHEARGDDGKPLHVVHRDVSPHNIMVREDGVAKMLDFGIAKSSSRADSVRTATGLVKGKLNYMSPEQMRGDRELDGRADQFALGVILWELLAGQRLFAGNSELEIFDKALRREIPRPSSAAQVPPELEAIAMRALERDRDQRFRDCAEMADALDAWIDTLSTNRGRVAAFLRLAMHDELDDRRKLIERETTGTTPSAPLEADQRRQQRGRGLLFGALAALLVVGGLGLAFVALRGLDDASAEVPALVHTEVLLRWDEAGQPVVEVSGPAGARITVDGVAWSSPPPATLRGLRPGEHEVELSQGGEVLLAEKLTIPAQRGAVPTLVVESEPEGAAVWIAGRMLGRTPFETTALPPGEHVLTLTRRGSPEREVTVSLSAGERTLTRVELSAPAARVKRKSSAEERRYQSARAALRKVEAERALRRGDDAELDREVSAMGRAARKKQFETAAAAAERATARAGAVSVDRAFVNGKLKRFNRRFAEVKDPAARKAISDQLALVVSSIGRGDHARANAQLNKAFGLLP